MRKGLWSAAVRGAIFTGILGAGLAPGSTAFAAPQDGGGEGMGGPPPAPPAAPAAKAPATPAGEDVLVLKDGTEIHGRITAENDSDYAVKVGGTLRVVGKSTVKEVRRGSPPADGGDAGGDGGAAPVPPAPGGDPAGGGKDKRRGRRRGENTPPGEGQPPAGADGAMPQPPPPLSEDARAWARGCIDRLQAADPMIQRSATEALRALGPSVLPVLREARDASADEKGKQALARVITLIEKGPRPGGDGRRPGADGGPPGARPGQQGAQGRGPALMERVRTELGLDEAQGRTVGKALLQFGRDVREVMMDARDGLITPEDARAKGTDLRGKLREDLKATLTEDQIKKLDGILDEMGKRMGGGPPPKDGGRKDGPPPPKAGDGAPPPAPPDAPK